MKPRLLIINGPLGIGKSTIAKLYADEHPHTLMLDIDDVWSMISHWRELKDTTAPLSKAMALAMAGINLTAGHDVIVPQILQTAELANRFQDLAVECGADYYEILLTVDKADAIKRFVLRGQAAGYPTGYRAGGIIDSSGRETKLSEMYDNMSQVAASRSHVIKIQSVFNDIKGTYDALLSSIS